MIHLIDQSYNETRDMEVRDMTYSARHDLQHKTRPTARDTTYSTRHDLQHETRPTAQDTTFSTYASSKQKEEAGEVFFWRGYEID